MPSLPKQPILSLEQIETDVLGFPQHYILLPRKRKKADLINYVPNQIKSTLSAVFRMNVIFKSVYVPVYNYIL